MRIRSYYNYCIIALCLILASSLFILSSASSSSSLLAYLLRCPATGRQLSWRVTTLTKGHANPKRTETKQELGKDTTAKDITTSRPREPAHDPEKS
jgi:hypothetical protein